MTGVLRRRRLPGEDIETQGDGRDWSHWELGEAGRLPPEPSEGWPCPHLGLLASRTETINVCSFDTTSVWSLFPQPPGAQASLNGRDGRCPLRGSGTAWCLARPQPASCARCGNRRPGRSLRWKDGRRQQGPALAFPPPTVLRFVPHRRSEVAEGGEHEAVVQSVESIPGLGAG